MLHAFVRSQNQHQDEQPATDSQLPIDAAEAIQYALSQRSLELLLRVKARGNSLNSISNRKTPLIQAVMTDDIATIQLLIQAGVDVNFRMRSGENALDIAIKDKKQAVLQALLTSPEIDFKSKNKARQNPLQLAFDKKNLNAFVAIAQRCDPNDPSVKALVNQYLYITIKSKKIAEFNALMQLPQVDVKMQFNKHTLLYWAMKSNDLAIISKLLPLSRRNFDIPLSKLIKDQAYFDNLENCKKLHDADNQVFYLDSYALSEPQVVAALRILEIEGKVALRDVSRKKASGSESAMNDAKVLAANRQFESKVKPHFEAQFNQLGLNTIECQIRKLILEEIKENATIANDKATLAFIKRRQASLVKGTAAAMRASVKMFNHSTVSHAAWRCYNPFAPVTGNWLNLHTRPINNAEVYSTRASNFANGTLKSHQASDIIRERTAYYYLAVVDSLDGDESVRKNRKGNFIGLLAEIRNTHGSEDPSCFPGQLTRIGQMGNYHEVAQLPNDLNDVLKHYFRSKVFEQFKAKIEGVAVQEQQQLLNAIINLNQLSARSIIDNPNSYDSTLLALRQAFLDALGNELKLFSEVKQQSTYAFEDDDLIYIQQHLVDIARGGIALALAEYAKRVNDRVATAADIDELSKLDNVSRNQNILFKRMLLSIFNSVPSYQKSYCQLKNIAEFIAAKIVVLGSQPEKMEHCLQEIVKALECDAELSRQLEQVFSQHLTSLGFVKINQSVANPFAAKLATTIEQSKQTKNLMLATRLEKMIPVLERKVASFNLFIPYLNQNRLLHPKPEKLIEYCQEIVEFCATNDHFNEAEFLKGLPEELLEIADQQAILQVATVLMPCRLQEPNQNGMENPRRGIRNY